VLAATGAEAACVTISMGVLEGPLQSLSVGRAASAKQVEVLARARAALSQDDFEVAASRGRAMSYDEVVAYTLAALREPDRSEVEAADA
jgi:hypothetical protein